MVTIMYIIKGLVYGLLSIVKDLFMVYVGLAMALSWSLLHGERPYHCSLDRSIQGLIWVIKGLVMALSYGSWQSYRKVGGSGHMKPYWLGVVHAAETAISAQFRACCLT